MLERLGCEEVEMLCAKYGCSYMLEREWVAQRDWGGCVLVYEVTNLVPHQILDPRHRHINSS